MDAERLAIFAGVSFVLGIGAFVLWGPAPRPRKRGQVSGIVNLGYTCFLNSLLQALSACPTFICWLKEQEKKRESSSFTNKLIAVANKINGYSKDLYDDVVPIEIITALGSLWKFDSGHQDAHELLHVILSALQSEIQFSNRIGCLSDALPLSQNITNNDSTHRSVSYDDIMHVDRASFGKIPNTKHNHMSKSSTSVAGFSMKNKPGIILARSSEMLTHLSQYESRNVNNRQKISKSLPTFPQQSNAISLHEMPPFSGLLTSQLKCTKCHWKSSVRYDKLETVSLPLPPAGELLKWRRHTLSELFSRLVTSEVINNVQCDGCASRCLAIKSLTLGKLPKCLCLHIPRTTWSNSGVPIKRDDLVIFPEIFILDPFTFSESLKRNVQVVLPAITNNDVHKAKHKYKLQAVVEHRGPVNAGHFVCYRRGNRSGQWLYTSDSIVENTSLANVLCANPYLLFYERIIDV